MLLSFSLGCSGLTNYLIKKWGIYRKLPIGYISRISWMQTGMVTCSIAMGLFSISYDLKSHVDHTCGNFPNTLAGTIVTQIEAFCFYILSSVTCLTM